VRLLQKEHVIKQINIDIDNHQALMETLINTTPDLIFFKNTDGVYLGCNKAFEKFAGKSEPEIIERTTSCSSEAKEPPFFGYQDSKMMQSGVPSINEEVCTFPDGKKGFLETLKSPFLTPTTI
jgi:PAS domain-containing protein